MEYREKSEETPDHTKDSISAEPQASQPMGDSSSSRSSSDSKRPKKKKKKVEMACVYCRRSHMICDDSRPCSRCIKRGIGHLCHDEPTPGRQRKKPAPNRSTNTTQPTSADPTPDITTSNQTLDQPDMAGYQAGNRTDPGSLFAQHQQPQAMAEQQTRPNNAGVPGFSGQTLSGVGGNVGALSKNLPFNEEPFFYSEHAGSEFSSLNDFLSMIDDPELGGSLGTNGNNPDSLMAFSMPQNNAQPGHHAQTQAQNPASLLSFSPNNMHQQTFENQTSDSPVLGHQQSQPPTNGNQYEQGPRSGPNDQSQPVISDSARDKFFLTAADPTTEISPEERLKQVIKAKLEAGLLQPYNYAKGYARLQGYMDNYMNQSSRQRILKPLSIFRPAFRAIARTLKDVDLVLVEESFERMLLDYDRVFTSMAIPACLWRRTGEIYRGNKEFASLVGVTTDDLKDGKLAIYELMSEESAVNFWEKYGAIAFDKGQKAVLTSCNLRTKDGFKRKSCCFSFTIRRDRYNIPSCIVGNFIPIDP